MPWFAVKLNPEEIDLAKFMTHVKFYSDCWGWNGAHDRGGYGRFWHKGRYVAAHRVIYTKLVGPIPWDKEIDHRCKFTGCVNPAHLEAVAHGENVFRGEIGQRAARRDNREWVDYNLEIGVLVDGADSKITKVEGRDMKQPPRSWIRANREARKQRRAA